MPPTTVPRWKTAIEQAISKYTEQTVIQIATLDTTRPNDSNTNNPTPRVRSHIFREFLASTPGAASPSLPILLSSTDVRTPKVAQLGMEPRAEVVWWIEGTQQQFRILADLYVVPEARAPSGARSLGSPNDEVHERFMSAVRRAREGTGIAAFRDSIPGGGGGGGGGQDMSEVEKEWESRRVAMFRTMSAHMKASWARPMPGRPLEEVGGPEAAKKWPERVVEPDGESEGLPEEEREERKRNWDMALGNFALVVIDPVEVDFVDLGTNPDRRWLFTKSKCEGGWVWDEKEIVP